ncbi:hypothetical protein [Xanthomonas sp. SHU 199]|uniref:hypothetical protein n=1 Tax=Xanthomonas sp. SHU 199 TaxID=1591174 RepID=UPI0003635F33|nr:hypothetical protein [Xanthomonas sp. SHU 199]
MTKPKTIALARQVAHNGKACGGRPIRVPLGKVSVRQILRRHLREEGHRIIDLCVPWKCRPQSVYNAFFDKRPFSPSHIDAAIQFLGLDEFDANELRLLGAREAGWHIDKTFLLGEQDSGCRPGRVG